MTKLEKFLDASNLTLRPRVFFCRRVGLVLHRSTGGGRSVGDLGFLWEA